MSCTCLYICVWYSFGCEYDTRHRPTNPVAGTLAVTICLRKFCTAICSASYSCYMLPVDHCLEANFVRVYNVCAMQALDLLKHIIRQASAWLHRVLRSCEHEAHCRAEASWFIVHSRRIQYSPHTCVSTQSSALKRLSCRTEPIILGLLLSLLLHLILLMITTAQQSCSVIWPI
jgi:hypothetical protein